METGYGACRLLAIVAQRGRFQPHDRISRADVNTCELTSELLMSVRPVRASWLTVILGLISVCELSSAQTNPSAAESYRVIREIALSGSEAFDLLSVDPIGRRLFVPRITRIDVVDIDRGTIVGSVRG